MKVGIAVYCTICSHRKAPKGRSAPPGLTLCNWECTGYKQDPQVGDLWPEETEKDFGYPVRDAGTKEVAVTDPKNPEAEDLKLEPWVVQHMIALRNAICATIPEPPALDKDGKYYSVGDDALVAWPARLLARAEAAEEKLNAIMRELGRNAADIEDHVGVARLVAMELRDLREWKRQQGGGIAQ